MSPPLFDRSVFRIFVLFFGTLSVSLPAFGALGGDRLSIDSDKRTLKAVEKKVTEHPTYTVVELESGGTVIREYLSIDGKIFALAWKGLAHPDLTVLLGQHASEYQRRHRIKEGQLGRRHHAMVSEHFVVERSGRLRNRQGRAYLPKELPTELQINDIQ